MYTVYNCSRSHRALVTAASLKELIDNGCFELGLDREMFSKLVLEEDGAEIDDEDCFPDLRETFVFILLLKGEEWYKKERALAKPDYSGKKDKTTYPDRDLKCLVNMLQKDEDCWRNFSFGELRVIEECPLAEFALYLEKLQDSAALIQNFCSEKLNQIDDEMERKELREIFTSSGELLKTELPAEDVSMHKNANRKPSDKDEILRPSEENLNTEITARNITVAVTASRNQSDQHLDCLPKTLSGSTAGEEAKRKQRHESPKVDVLSKTDRDNTEVGKVKEVSCNQSNNYNNYNDKEKYQKTIQQLEGSASKETPPINAFDNMHAKLVKREAYSEKAMKAKIEDNSLRKTKDEDIHQQREQWDTSIKVNGRSISGIDITGSTKYVSDPELETECLNDSNKMCPMFWDDFSIVDSFRLLFYLGIIQKSQFLREKIYRRAKRVGSLNRINFQLTASNAIDMNNKTPHEDLRLLDKDMGSIDPEIRKDRDDADFVKDKLRFFNAIAIIY